MSSSPHTPSPPDKQIQTISCILSSLPPFILASFHPFILASSHPFILASLHPLILASFYIFHESGYPSRQTFEIFMNRFFTANITKIFSQSQLRIHLCYRSTCNHKKMNEICRGLAQRTFSNVRRDGNDRPPNLINETKPFRRRKRGSHLINNLHKLPCFLPNF